MSKDRFTVELEQQTGFQFLVRFAEGTLITDEPAPTGTGSGPHPAELLGAAVSNCLAASLVFCMNKARSPQEPLKVKAEGRIERNSQGQLRIAQIDVTLIAPSAGARCLELFENYCIVTESVRAGIPIHVTVTDAQAQILHRSS